MAVKTISIALPESLYEFAQLRAENEGHPSVTDFVTALVHAEAVEHSIEPAQAISSQADGEEAATESWLVSQLRRSTDRPQTADL